MDFRFVDLKSESYEAASREVGVEADATLCMPGLTLPPSDFVSEELKKAYVEHTGRLRIFLRHARPAGNAPQVDWDEYNALHHRSYIENYLSQDHERYPTNLFDTEIAGVRVGIVTPEDGVAPEHEGRVLINLRGGGFVLGRGLALGQLASIPIASISKMKVITIDFRQSPHHKHPAASEDVEAVYGELLKQYKPESIGIFGNSSGAIVTAQAVAWFQTRGLPRPGAIGLFWAAPTPYGKHGDSRIWDMSGGVGSTSSKTKTSRLTGYMEDLDINDPRAFPGSSDAVLSMFPPTLLLSGTRATDLSPVVVAHARFLKLGVHSYLYIMEGGWHGALTQAGYAPERHDVNAYIASWFDQHLA